MKAHPTKLLLINTVLELLKHEHLQDITIEEVVAESGISRGSLYHHFEDFADLLEQAQIKRFSNYVDMTSNLVAEALSLSSKDEFVRAIRVVTRQTQSEEMRDQRLHRIKAVAAVGQSERMRKYYSQEQERLTATIATMYSELLNRGWGNPNIQPVTIAVFIQSYTMGQAINDYVETKMDRDNWISLIDLIMESIILDSPESAKELPH